MTGGFPATDRVGQRVVISQRDFDRALVISRPPTGWSTQRYDDASAIGAPLPAGETWIPMHAKGTLGAPATTVMLRNTEAVIPIKQHRSRSFTLRSARRNAAFAYIRPAATRPRAK